MMVYAQYPRPWRMAIAGLGATLATGASLVGAAAAPLAYAGLGIMTLALAVRRELILDPKTRTYRWLDGIWPLMPSRTGTFDDLRWVQIDAYETTVESSTTTYQTVITYTITLTWKRNVATIPWPIAKTPDFEAAGKAALELAKFADIPVVETSEMKRLRPENTAAAYDPRLAVPVDTRPHGLKARLRG
ncbi:MAG: hypothetical protein ACO1SV_03380 [Fimbriimonas sp.]